MSNQFYNYLLNLNEYDRKIKLTNSLAVSINEFQERWETYAKEFKFQYEHLEIKKDNNVFNIKISENKNIAFLGDIIEYGNEKILKNINMLASGDGTPQSVVNIFIAIGILIACLNPQENIDFRNEILKELDMFNLKIGMKSAILKNDFIYTVNFTKEIGLWFSVKRK